MMNDELKGFYLYFCIHLSCFNASLSPDKNRSHRNHFPGRKVCRVVARHRQVTVARRHLAVNLHRLASHLNRPLVRRRLLKSRAGRRRNVRRGVISYAADGRRRLPHNLHIAAQTVLDDACERVRQRRRHRRRWRRWNHHDVRIYGDYLVALFSCRLSHKTSDR